MNELENYLLATVDAKPMFYGKQGKCIAMSDPTTWEGYAHEIMHPTREGEVVGCFHFDWTYDFTPAFVKECFEASKDGGNPLIDVINNNLPQL